jgi:hypothetical protein
MPDVLAEPTAPTMRRSAEAAGGTVVVADGEPTNLKRSLAREDLMLVAALLSIRAARDPGGARLL